MDKLFKKRNRIIILIIYLSLSIILGGLITVTKVNYDMKKYLPSSSNTKKSFEVMEAEFGQTSMIQVMTDNLDLTKGNSFANEISNLESVKSVIWLGTMTDITIPIENINNEIKEEFYKDGKLIFTIEFNKDEYSLEVGADITKIRQTLVRFNTDGFFRGEPINNISNREKVENEMIWIFVVAVPIAILILFLAAKSWIEPVVVLINLSVAILFNMGTNFVLGEISYITIAIASVLQMAMSLDFSLFLIHRYYEERDLGKDKIEAITDSTKAAFGSISASAMTTIFGFLALTIMQYKIGFDIGVSLAKAILLSYITTFTLLPILILWFDKLLFKTRRKDRDISFRKTNNFLQRFKIPVLVFILTIGGLSLYMQSKTNYIYGDGVIKDENDVVYTDEVAITNTFGSFQPVIILYNNNDKSKAIALSNELLDIAEVRQIQSLVTSVPPEIPEIIVPPEALEQFKGPNYSRMIVYLDILEESERMYELSDQIKRLSSIYLNDDTYVLGLPIAIDEIRESVNYDGIWIQLISAIVIALIIGIVFKNPIIPIILVLLIEISIWINISITGLIGTSLVYIGYLVVSSLQLGATIDYAVLLTSRYQEERKYLNKKEAIGKALQLAVPTIITSSLVLSAAGFVVLFVSKLGIVQEIGFLIGRGALLSGVLVIFILPVLLTTFDKAINKTMIKWRFRKNEKENN